MADNLGVRRKDWVIVRFDISEVMPGLWDKVSRAFYASDDGDEYDMEVLTPS